MHDTGLNESADSEGQFDALDISYFLNIQYLRKHNFTLILLEMFYYGLLYCSQI